MIPTTNKRKEHNLTICKCILAGCIPLLGIGGYLGSSMIQEHRAHVETMGYIRDLVSERAIDKIVIGWSSILKGDYSEDDEQDLRTKISPMVKQWIYEIPENDLDTSTLIGLDFYDNIDQVPTESKYKNTFTCNLSDMTDKCSNVIVLHLAEDNCIGNMDSFK